MDRQAFEDYLVNRYEDQINWYRAKASTNKRRYQIFQWCVIVLAAVVPVLVTASPQAATEANSTIWWVTVVASVLLAIGTAGIKAFKFQENWINYRSTAERLLQEKYFYDGGISGYGETDNKESLFVKRVEEIISGESTQWVTAQSSKSG